MPLSRPIPFPSDEAFARPSPPAAPPVGVSAPEVAPPAPAVEAAEEVEAVEDDLTDDEVLSLWEGGEAVEVVTGPEAEGPDESEWDPEGDGVTDQELAEKLSKAFTKPQLYEQAQRLGVPGVNAHSNKPVIVAALVDAYRDEMAELVS